MNTSDDNNSDNDGDDNIYNDNSNQVERDSLWSRWPFHHLQS